MEPNQPTPAATITQAPMPSSVFVIRRHPIGLVFIYLQAFFALAAIVLLAFLVVPSTTGHLSNTAMDTIDAVALLFVGFMGIILMVATIVYRRNQLIVTDHDIEEINQRSLVARKVSRLELNDVEDVAAEQKGILQTMFGYGTLTVETAGAIDNFVFTYCPHPGQYSQRILEARARYISALPAPQTPQPTP
jgi:hypothetical protein